MTGLFKRKNIALFSVLTVSQIAILFLASLFIYRLENRNLLDTLSKGESEKLTLQLQDIINDFESIERDVLLLKDLIAQVDDYSCAKGKTFEVLKDEFYRFIIRKRFYDQIRFLDTTGNELIRINYNGGNPYIENESQLQNKADRYYFKQLKSFKDSVLFFSKFDLNIENGKIEEPYKPVIRIGTKVLTCKDVFCGIVIVNYMGSDLIHRLQAVNTNSLSEINVLDPESYFLISAIQENNWGFMFEDKKNTLFANLYPNEWQIIHKNDNGQFTTEKGLFTYHTLKFQQIHENASGNILHYYATDDYWKILSFLPIEVIKNRERQILKGFILPESVLVILLIIISFILTYLKAKDKVARDIIIEKKNFLINIINSISDPLYIICPLSNTVDLANLQANTFGIIEGYNFDRNILFNSKENEEEFEKFRSSIIASKEHNHLELTSKTEKSTTVYYNISGYPVFNEIGDVEKIIEVLQNVTDEKLSEQKFSVLFHNQTQFTGLLEIDGTIIEANKTFLRFGGYIPDDIKGKKFWELPLWNISEISENKIKSDIEKAANGEFIRYELDLIGSGNNKITIDYSLKPVVDENGNVQLLIPEGRDITENKRYREEIIKKQEMLTEAQRIAQLGFWEYNLKQHTFFWSDEVYNIFEETGQDLKIDRNFFLNMMSEKDGKSLVELEKKTVTNRTSNEFEHKIFLKNGKVKTINGLMHARIENDEVVGLYGTLHDITRHKIAEEEIRRLNEGLEQKVKDRTLELENAYKEISTSKEEAEEANRAKSIFLANMSHEIRTPMNAVIGFSELLSQQVKDPIQKDFVESIKSSGKTLLGIINDILDLSKIEAGKFELQANSVKIRDLVKDVDALFKIKAEEKKLDFILTVSDNIPAYLIIDELRLKQVLINLISNAIKFTKKGYIKVTFESKNNTRKAIDLDISVEDSGIGISEKDQIKIFEEFHQTEGQNTKEYGGTGLGLAISRRIVHLMGSEIKVSSRLNIGSRFSFYLNSVLIGEESSYNISKPYNYKPDEIEFKNSCILIVDDNIKNRKLLTSFLSRYQLKLQEASSGKEAIQKCRDSSPDLILMDIRMPEMDGFSALKEIRQKSAEEKIPVIAITASINLNDELTKKGFNALLHKPLSFDELINLLTEYLPFNKKGESNEENTSITDIRLNNVFTNENEKVKFVKESEDVFNDISVRKSNKVVSILSERLITYGLENNIDQLVKKGESLAIAIKSFNVDIIEDIIDEFISLHKSSS